MLDTLSSTALAGGHELCVEVFRASPSNFQMRSVPECLAQLAEGRNKWKRKKTSLLLLTVVMVHAASF